MTDPDPALPPAAPKEPPSLAEHWLPVVGYEGHYEVSDLGRVRTVAKTTYGGFFVHGDKKIHSPRHRPSQLLKVSYGGRNNRYLRVMLRAGGNKKRHAFIHHLVLEAFVGPRPRISPDLVTGEDRYMVAAHTDDDQSNNTLRNLSWKTEDENLTDRLERERREELDNTELDREAARARGEENEGRSEPGPDQPSRESEPDEDEPGIDPNTYVGLPTAPF